jgi:hypothetical protein
MPKYNQEFVLNPKEIDLIEHAVRDQIAKLSLANVSANFNGSEPSERKIKELNELLGKLHNKKIWWGQVHPTGVPLG